MSLGFYIDIYHIGYSDEKYMELTFELEIRGLRHSKAQVKKIFLYGIFLYQLSLPLVPYAAVAVGVTLQPSASVATLRDRNLRQIEKSSTRKTNLVQELPSLYVDKIQFEEKTFNELQRIANQLGSNSITLNEAHKALLAIRGGGLTEVIGIIAFVILANWYNSPTSVEGFQPRILPHMDPFGFWSGKYDQKPNSKSSSYLPSSFDGETSSRPMTFLEMEKPDSMSQHEYSSMSKAERRQLPDPGMRDAFINVEGYPDLTVMYNQVEFKLPKHGQDHGLPKGDNGKTPKTEKNAIALRDSLVDMPNRKNIVWYTDGQYQGGTPRGCDCVSLFDPDTNVIALYKKQPDGSNLFLTTCTLTDIERDHLESTNGNFVTEKILGQQNWVSDDRRITPLTPMDENSSPGFNPTSSFESDVMGITPINESQSNKP